MHGKKNNLYKKSKPFFNNHGSVIDKGAIYVVVFLTLIIFGSYMIVGGTLPAKLPQANTNLVDLYIPTAEPTKGGLQLYTFYGSTPTPRPTKPPHQVPPLTGPQLIDCKRELSGSQESSMIWGYLLDSSPASGNELALKVFYTNKHALVLGSGAVSQMQKHPADHVANPSFGDTSVRDDDNFPIFPAIFLTDITTAKTGTSGDAQAGGEPNAPSDIYGAWKALGANDPQSNGRDLGPGADAWPTANGPAGSHDSNFVAEIVWKLSALEARDPVTGQFAPLKPGNIYRVQIVLHDGGDPTDIGVACLQFTMPGSGTGQTYTATSCSEINALISAAAPGSTVMIADGVYPSCPISVNGKKGQAGAPITVTSATPQGANIQAGEDCIRIMDSNYLVFDKIRIGPCGDEGVEIINGGNITVKGSYFDDPLRGVSVYKAENGIVISGNTFLIKRPKKAAATFVQFDRVNGSGHRISCNIGDNTSTRFGDGINLYGSSGLAGDPILIQGNKLRTVSNSEGAIIQLGDSALPEHIPGRYQKATDNIVIVKVANSTKPANGMAIGGGSDMEMANNKIYARYPTANGHGHGLIAFNWLGDDGYNPATNWYKETESMPRKPMEWM
jgi:hypothetical protein